jgi:hypothetical protein
MKTSLHTPSIGRLRRGRVRERESSREREFERESSREFVRENSRKRMIYKRIGEKSRAEQRRAKQPENETR